MLLLTKQDSATWQGQADILESKNSSEFQSWSLLQNKTPPPNYSFPELMAPSCPFNRNFSNGFILRTRTLHLSSVEKLQKHSRGSNSLSFFRLSFSRGRRLVGLAELSRGTIHTWLTFSTWRPRWWRNPPRDNVCNLSHHSWLCAENWISCVLWSLNAVAFTSDSMGALCVSRTVCNEAVAVTFSQRKAALKYGSIMSVRPPHTSSSGLLKHHIGGDDISWSSRNTVDGGKDK